MRNIIRKILITFCVCFLFSGIIQGAPQLYVDFKVNTTATDSLCAPNKDSLFTAGLYIKDIDSLFGYQFYLQFDTSKIAYISSAAGSQSAPHFMGNSVTFECALSNNNKSQILVAGYLKRGSASANGSGYLGLITFRKLTTDSSTLVLSDPIFLMYSESEIVVNPLHNGYILPPGSIPVKLVYSKNTKNVIRVTNGILHYDLPQKSNSLFRLLDLSGRCLIQRESQSKHISINLPRTSSGIFLVTITNNNRTQVYSVLTKL